jgi:hypothetical protein
VSQRALKLMTDAHLRFGKAAESPADALNRPGFAGGSNL